MKLTLTIQVPKLAAALTQIAENIEGVSLQIVIVRTIKSLVEFFNERCGMVGGNPFGDRPGDESCAQLCAELIKTSIDDMDWTERKARNFMLRMAKCLRELMCQHYDSRSGAVKKSLAKIEVRAIQGHFLSSQRM